MDNGMGRYAANFWSEFEKTDSDFAGPAVGFEQLITINMDDKRACRPPVGFEKSLSSFVFSCPVTSFIFFIEGERVMLVLHLKGFKTILSF